jgi:hypothetical protein
MTMKIEPSALLAWLSGIENDYAVRDGDGFSLTKRDAPMFFALRSLVANQGKVDARLAPVPVQRNLFGEVRA